MRSAFVKLAADSPPTGATFMPDVHAFINLGYIHERWSNRYVPPQFLGLQADSADDEEESEEETGSSTMEWEVCTVDDEEL